MAKALSITKKMTLVAKANNAAEPKPIESKEMMLPILGNLALLASCVCCLSGEEPTLKGTIPKEVKIKANVLDVLRVTVPMKYIPKKHHNLLYERPEFALRLCEWSAETKTHRCESAQGCITGLANLAKGHAEELLKQSGKGGVFWSQLAQNVTVKPDITWIVPEDGEEPLKYFARVQIEAEKASVPMAFRKGGGADLGVQKRSEDESHRSYANWGIPGHFGPESIAELLTAEGWKLSGRPTAPRTTKGPWRAQGQAPDNQLEWGYKYEIGGKIKHINVVPWRTNRKIEGETEHIAKTRWFSKDDEFEIQPTVLDPLSQTQSTQRTTMEVDEGFKSNKRKDATGELTAKKAAKKKSSVIKGGIEGPLQTRILNLGGNGDCAWRVLAYLIAQTNAKWTKDEHEIAERSDALGAVLRAQAITNLTVKDQSWEESYCEDPRWTTTTEGGEPARDLDDFKNNVLPRPNRYICHLGLQAVATSKKINILIWELLEDKWTKVALLTPPSYGAKTPTIHLALGGQHYFACVKQSRAYPKALAEIEELGGIFVSHGLESDVIENSQKDMDMAIFRAAGGHHEFVTLMKSRSKSVDSLLRSFRSTSSRSSDLLRTCSSAKSLKHNGESKYRQMNWINNQMKNGRWKCKLCEFEIKVQSRCERMSIIRHMNDNHPKEREAQNAALKNYSNERQLKRSEEWERVAKEEEKNGRERGHLPIRVQMKFKRGRTGKIGVICKRCLTQPLQRKKGVWNGDCNGTPQETMWGEAKPGSQWWRRVADPEEAVGRLDVPCRWKHRILKEIPNETKIEFEKVQTQEADLICPFCKLGVKNFKKATYNAQQIKLQHLKSCKMAPVGANCRTWHNACVRNHETTWHRVRCKRLALGRLKKRGSEKYSHDPTVISLRKPNRKRMMNLTMCKRCLIPAENKRRWRRPCIAGVAYNSKEEVMPGPF